MNRVEWTDDLAVGSELIDAQHQQLPIFIGGKSMGGRVAATIASTSDEAQQLNSANVNNEQPFHLPNTIKGVVCLGR